MYGHASGIREFALFSFRRAGSVCAVWAVGILVFLGSRCLGVVVLDGIVLVRRVFRFHRYVSSTQLEFDESALRCMSSLGDGNRQDW
jgi:hypothetical protein